MSKAEIFFFCLLEHLKVRTREQCFLLFNVTTFCLMLNDVFFKCGYFGMWILRDLVIQPRKGTIRFISCFEVWVYLCERLLISTSQILLSVIPFQHQQYNLSLDWMEGGGVGAAPCCSLSQCSKQRLHLLPYCLLHLVFSCS